jgi:MoaA/NifB/PqqE/SkfB family radical SAM enzyme
MSESLTPDTLLQVAQHASAEDSPGISSVDWWITSRCNLACDYCYGPEPGQDPVELRDSVANAIGESEAEIVTFCGGEPLTVKDIFRYAREFQRRGKRTVLNTNGELLRGRVQAESDFPFDLVGFSLEGDTPERHGEMRQTVKGEPANLAETFAAAQLVKTDTKAQLKVANVVSAVSVSWLRDLIWFERYELGPDRIRLYHYNPNGPNGYNRGRDRHAISKVDFDTAVKEAERQAYPYEIHASDNESQHCLIVDPNGGVSVSTKDGYKLLGNCLDESITAILGERSEYARLVNRNKQWIGALALNQNGGPQHNANLGASVDCSLGDQRAARPASAWVAGLHMMRRYFADEFANTTGYQDAKRKCLSSVSSLLSPEAAEAYWQASVHELMTCDPNGPKTWRLTDRFLYYGKDTIYQAY